MNEEEPEGFPRNQWVRASSKHDKSQNVYTETQYMLLPQGAMMRVRSFSIEEKPNIYTDSLIPPRAISEALQYIPGNYTLKSKRGSDHVVLELKK